MLAQHEWPECNRKRTREEEYADISNAGTLGFTEHRSKRLQALPLRTSPNSKRWSDPPSFPPNYPSFSAQTSSYTITPSDSDSEEPTSIQQQGFQQSEHGACAPVPELLTQQPSPSTMMSDVVDGDMDMMDTSDPAPVDHLEPGPFQPDPIAPSITGRMPTPIHCSFASQVRSNNWNRAVGSNMQGAPLGPPAPIASEMAFRSNGRAEGFPGTVLTMLGHESVPRSLDGPAATAAVMADWSMVQDRRLPSPISESGGEETVESPTMVLDATTPLGEFNHHGHQHPLLSSLPPRASSVSEIGQMFTPPPLEHGSVDDSHSVHVMDVESPATPSPKKGHTRSRHTLNSWTAVQPGMKKSFSIGYRADCEKCRMKVPGHFNHIIIS